MSNEPSHKLRWRGTESGPYPWSAIEQMLAELQIGLHHEIEHEGRWFTLRDFIAHKAKIEPVRDPIPPGQPKPPPFNYTLAGEVAGPTSQVRRFKLPSFKANRKA
jgi:hypothetical protein